MSDADALMKKGDAAASKAGSGKKLFGFFSGGSGAEELRDDATEAYKQAAMIYRRGNQPDRATEAHIRAANVYLSGDDKYSAANEYYEAYKDLRDANPSASVSHLIRCVQLFDEQPGKEFQASRKRDELADMFARLGDTQSACNAWRQTAESYERENNQATANRVWSKYIDASGLAGLYRNVFELCDEREALERVKARFDQRMYMSWSNQMPKQRMLRSVLCHLVLGDPGKCNSLFQLYSDFLGPGTLERSYEMKFAHALMQALEDQDMEMLTGLEQGRLNSVIYTPDDWEREMIKKIKKQVEDEDDMT